MKKPHKHGQKWRVIADRKWVTFDSEGEAINFCQELDLREREQKMKVNRGYRIPTKASFAIAGKQWIEHLTVMGKSAACVAKSELVLRRFTRLGSIEFLQDISPDVLDIMSANLRHRPHSNVLLKRNPDSGG
jgi:hypothetical protein